MPKGPAEERIHLRATADEKARMEAAAAAEGMKLSQFLRHLFLQWERKRK